MPLGLAAPPIPVLPTAAPPDKAAAIKGAVQAIYDAEDTALVAHDLDGVMAMYTPNVVFFDSLKGKQDVGAAGARRAWATFFQVPHQTLTAARHEIKEVTVNKAGTGATVLAVHHLTISAAPANGAAAGGDAPGQHSAVLLDQEGRGLAHPAGAYSRGGYIRGRQAGRAQHKQIPT